MKSGHRSFLQSMSSSIVTLWAKYDYKCIYAKMVFYWAGTKAGSLCVCVCVCVGGGGVCLQEETATGYLAQHQLFDQVTFCFSDLVRLGPVPT